MPTWEEERMPKSRPDRCEHNLDGGFCAVHFKGKGRDKKPLPCKGFNKECPKKVKKAKGK